LYSTNDALPGHVTKNSAHGLQNNVMQSDLEGVPSPTSGGPVKVGGSYFTPIGGKPPNVGQSSIGGQLTNGGMTLSGGKISTGIFNRNPLNIG